MALEQAQGWVLAAHGAFKTPNGSESPAVPSAGQRSRQLEADVGGGSSVPRARRGARAAGAEPLRHCSRRGRAHSSPAPNPNQMGEHSLVWGSGNENGSSAKGE